MDLPKFTPTLPPAIEHANGSSVDYRHLQECSACGALSWDRDASTGTCRSCWRILVALPVVLEERRGAPVASLDVARELQAVPRLTDEADGAGVALDVGLVPPRTKGRKP